ncbi:MAG TPA: hypothetical protein VLM75_14480 [Spirochaetota bacterium]|nr:hypothetical protein [Spirochaetota bacterium]
MRNTFDQYTQPENKLTHALFSSLHHDQKLLRSFLRFVTSGRLNPKGTLKTIEQSIPGIDELPEDESTRKGLPDACIYTDDDWILAVESKVASQVSKDQLNRHVRTIARHGYSTIYLLVIDTEHFDAASVANTFSITWSKIYEWGCAQMYNHPWAAEFVRYFEVAEARMRQDSYLKQGKITKYSGIHFDDDNPYSYGEAKRLLGLLIGEIKSDRKFLKEIGIDPNSKGRGAITGKNSRSVWDYLSILGSGDESGFTSYPHVSFIIGDSSFELSVTIPNAVKKYLFNAVFDQEFSNYQKLLLRVLNNHHPVLKKDKGAIPFIRIHQRFYPSQKSTPIMISLLQFDMRTMLDNGKNKVVKYQPEWMRFSYDIMRNKRSNIEFHAGVEFPYPRSTCIMQREGIQLIKDSMAGLRPFYDHALAKEELIYPLEQKTGSADTINNDKFSPPTEECIQEYLDWDDCKVMGLVKGGHAGEHGRILLARQHYRRIFETPERPEQSDLEKLETLNKN